ncbi:hypothetical protein F4861DRAFT_252163 [Xylaria intraflava]|nr:hypothetical protein F4861DRAFT_252163 [Xylaria intraflava]
MPTPFICQKCAARIAKSTLKLPGANQVLSYTKLSPVRRPSYSSVSPPRYKRRGRPRSPQSLHRSAILKDNSDGGSSRFLPPISTTPPQGQEQEQYDAIDENAEQTQTRSYQTRKMRLLHAKILAANGDYELVHKDLKSTFTLSRAEAHHAVDQVRRLLLDNPEMTTAASQVDRYLSWKRSFSDSLRGFGSLSSIQRDMADLDDSEPPTVFPEFGTASMETVWQRLDQDRRERLWPYMVLSALKSEPRSLPALIYATFDPSWCPGYVVEDMLYILYRRLHLARWERDARKVRQLQQGFTTMATYILERCPRGYLVLEQTVLHLISSLLIPSAIIPLHQVLKQIEHPLSENTLLQFASRLAKSHDTKSDALDIIYSLTERPEFNLNAPSAASVCTSLLSLNENDPLPDPRAAPDVLFEFLLERGFRPNLLQLSALMRNFCIRGHMDTAWEIFGLMVRHGLEHDRHVYSILLNGSKRNSNSALTEKILNIIKSRNAWSPYLINDFLDVLYQENEFQAELRRRQRKKVNNAWRPMLRLYAKFYDLAPLQKFTLFPLENLLEMWAVRVRYSTYLTKLVESLPPLPHDRLMQPDSTAICLMIRAHMRSINSPKYVMSYYDHFYKLVLQKDKAALRLLADRGALVYNIFLSSFLQFRETIGFAVRILQRMISDADKEKAELGTNVYHHPPTVHTWTMVLNGLRNHHDARGALAIVNFMTRIGHVKPSLATWNALIHVFARARNVDGAVRAVWLLEQAGFQPNDRTMQAFNVFPRLLRDEAIRQLERMRQDPDGFAKTQESARNSASQYNANGTTQQGGRNSMPKSLEELAESRSDVHVEWVGKTPKSRRKPRDDSEHNFYLPPHVQRGPWPATFPTL